jgi:hypothetical protein
VAPFKLLPLKVTVSVVAWVTGLPTPVELEDQLVVVLHVLVPVEFQ